VTRNTNKGVRGSSSSAQQGHSVDGVLKRFYSIQNKHIPTAATDAPAIRHLRGDFYMNIFRRIFSGGSQSFCRSVETGDLARVGVMIKKNPGLVSVRCGKYDETPLHYASRIGHVEIAKLLLENGASVESKDGLDGTPLHRAAYNGHKNIVQLLINSGAKVDVEGDRFGQTPLFSAAGRGYTEIADLLLSKGANINAENSHGYTPLHFAAIKGHKGVVELLIRKGANVNKRSKDGVTPLDQALVERNHEVVELLRAHEAR
jgi:hypothetical protein